MVGLSFSMITNEMIANDSYELIWGFAPEQEARNCTKPLHGSGVSYELIWGFAPEQEARTNILKGPK